MKNRTSPREQQIAALDLPMKHLLAAAVFAGLLGAGQAEAKGYMGNEVDDFCRDFNGTEPYNDEGCSLCHTSDRDEYVDPEWDWYWDNEFQNFCPTVAVNTPPVLAATGNKTATQGSELSFTVSAVDADGDDLSFSASGLANGASFNDNGDGTADFSWTPSAQQSGNFPLVITVTDNGDPVESDSESITISVGVANRPPVMEAINDRSADVGSEISFTVNASDPDNDGLTLSADNLPSGANFTDNLDGSGSFSWTPQAGQEGAHQLQFTVVDNGIPQASDSETVNLTIGAAPVGNTAPVLAAIGNQAVAIDAGLELSLSASDGNADDVSFSASNLPTGATLTDNGNGTAALSWTPTADQAGQHEITISVSDGQTPPLSDSETFTVTVGGGNQPPVLAAIGQRAFDLGLRLEMPVSASDPDGDSLSFSASDLPTGAELIDNGDNTALLRWTPDSDQIGEHTVTISVSDGTANDDETFGITVREASTPGTGAGTDNSSDNTQTVEWGAAGSPWGLFGLLLVTIGGRLLRRKR